MEASTETAAQPLSLVEQKQALERATAQRITDLLVARSRAIADHETALQNIADELKALGHKRPRTVVPKNTAVA